MEKKLLILIFLLGFTSISAQAKFEKGYIINSQGVKIECLIKNKDWINSPNKLEYKLSDGSTVEMLQVIDINEFKIYDSSEFYKKFTVSIDRNLTTKEFSPEKEQLFLRILIEGDATLYEENSGIFFYQKDNGEIKQLIYKEYETVDRKIKRDNLFRAELYNEFKCIEDAAVKLRKVDYNRKELADFFIKHNQCTKIDYSNYTKEKTPFKIGLEAFTGIYTNNFDSQIVVGTMAFDPPVNSAIDMSTTSSNLTLGVQLELLLPFHNHKWSVIFSPNYQSLKIDGSNYSSLPYEKMVQGLPSQGGGTVIVTDYMNIKLTTNFQYNFIEAPIGLRHYLNLNPTSKLFLDASVGFIHYIQKPSETGTIEKLDSDPNQPGIAIIQSKKKPSSTFKIGAGYKLKDRYSIGLNYSQREMSYNSGSSLSAILSYKLF